MHETKVVSFSGGFEFNMVSCLRPTDMYTYNDNSNMAFLLQKIPFGKSAATQPNQVNKEIIPHDDDGISSRTDKETK